MTVVSREKVVEREMIRGKKRFMNDRQFTPLWRLATAHFQSQDRFNGCVPPQCLMYT